ncbi:MAG: ABC transporter permease [Oscillospiraceae bacterium]|nr:ABC transporter permease [Oscillospiraceae bacterium]
MVKHSGFGENIKLAFRGISTHKMRSFLTMLGIIIGIASIIAIVSTIRGTNEQIKQNLIGAGTNSVTVKIKQNEWDYEFDWMGIPEGFYPVSEETMRQIRELPGVRSAARFVSRNNSGSVSYGAVTLDNCGVIGVENDYFVAAGLQAVKGRLFGEHDAANFSKVAVLDRSAAKSIFSGKEPIGETIEISGEAFLVVGVVDTRNSFSPVIETMQDYYTYMGNKAARVYIPIADWPILFQFDEPESVIVRARDTDSMTEVGRATAELLNGALGIGEAKDAQGGDQEIRYKADDLLEQAKQIQDLSRSTNSMLIWIAGISLLVGGIGVMNIMLVSVTERTREIGLKKALGARKNRILSQFLTEAAVLTSIGGILGVAVGIALSYVIQFVAQVPVSISLPAILISVVFSTVVGIVFGLLPSIQASKLDPIEALRYE